MINQYGHEYEYVLETLERYGVTIVWYFSDDGLFYPNESMMLFYHDDYWNI